MPSQLGPRIPIHPEDRHRLCRENKARRRQPIVVSKNGNHEASTRYSDTYLHTTKSPPTLGPRIPIHPEDRLILRQQDESRWRQPSSLVENRNHETSTDFARTPSSLGPRIPIHPAERRHFLQENEAYHHHTITSPRNKNHQVPTHTHSPRTPPPPHITNSSSSSTLVSHTPVNLSLRGGYSPTLSGNDTPSSTTHHTLHPFEGENLSFFSSTRGLLDYDLANDTWIPSANAPKQGGEERGAARAVGRGLVTEMGTRRFLPWYGRLLAARQQEEEEEAELRWGRERVWGRRGGMSGRYVNENVDGAGDGGAGGGDETKTEIEVIEDEEKVARGRERGTSEEESEERRKTRAEEWERREETREKIEALLAAEGSGDADGNVEVDAAKGEPEATTRRKS